MKKPWSQICTKISTYKSKYYKVANRKKVTNKAHLQHLSIEVPADTVKSHADWTTAFMESGAWEYANSRPVILNMISPAVMTTYWGVCHNNDSVCPDAALLSMAICRRPEQRNATELRTMPTTILGMGRKLKPRFSRNG